MPKPATTVAEYLDNLPADRQAAVRAVREVILKHLPEGYEECLSYGMIGYVVPHRIHPAGYHCNPKLPLPYLNLGSQKNHLVLHLLPIYGNPELDHWFRTAWLATGKKLDLGKACLRFKKIEDVSLKVLGQLVARTPVKKYVARMLQNIAEAKKSRAKPAARKKTPKK